MGCASMAPRGTVLVLVITASGALSAAKSVLVGRSVHVHSTEPAILSPELATALLPNTRGTGQDRYVTRA